MGLAIDFYAFIEIERYGKDRLGFIMPQGKTVVSADGIAVLKNALSPEIAAMFMEYVLGEGQKLWILKKGIAGGPVEKPLCRFPVDTRLYKLDTAILSVSGNPFELPMSLRYDAKTGSKRWMLLNDMIASIIITPHRELKSCRSHLIKSNASAEEISRILRIDISENEAADLAVKWSQRDFAMERIRLMNQWTTSAKKRYSAESNKRKAVSGGQTRTNTLCAKQNRKYS
jgi:hypothetical protein